MEDKFEREIKKLNKRIHRQVSEAVIDFNMIEPNDKIMVCLSGGKDSYTMLDVLMTLQRRAPFPFEILAVNLDQKQPGFPAEILPEYLTQLNVPFHIETQDTYSIVTRVIEPGKTMCSLCSRLRRGILYQIAEQFQVTKIALGHHRDDIMATFFLNLFYGGNLKGMPPKLLSDDKKNVVIRPLAYVKEADIIRYAEWKKFPIIPCNLCGSQENLKRQAMNKMMQQWNKEHPGRLENIFNALSRVTPSHLMDKRHFNFIDLSVNSLEDFEGDMAFDPPNFEANASCSDDSDDAPAVVFKSIPISLQ